MVIGVLAGLNEQNQPLVAFPGNPDPGCIAAQSTILFNLSDVGRELALLFENGDPRRPLVIGRIQHPESQSLERPLTAGVDGERILLSAKNEIVLQARQGQYHADQGG